MGNLKKVFVGFSVNPELVLRFSAELGFEKVPGKTHNMSFSGSSANISNALSLWGVNTLLLGAVGVERSDADDYLEITLRKTAVLFQRIPVLTETSFAPVLANELVGNGLISYKGKVVESHIDLAIERITQTLNSDEGFRVASGITEDQALLAKVLWGEYAGFRTFCPHRSLLQNKKVFFELCSFADLVIMNTSELDSSGIQISEIHQRGTRLVIITNGKKGGMFSLAGKSVEYAAQEAQGIVFGTGAGDWFHAMIVCFFRDHNLNFATASLDDFKDAVNFASRVVARKVTYPGGAEGPARNDF